MGREGSLGENRRKLAFLMSPQSTRWRLQRLLAFSYISLLWISVRDDLLFCTVNHGQQNAKSANFDRGTGPRDDYQKTDENHDFSTVNGQPKVNWISNFSYIFLFALTVDRWKIVIFVRFLVVISGPGASVKIRVFRLLLTVVDRRLTIFAVVSWHKKT